VRKFILVVATCVVVYMTTYFSCGSSYPPASSGGGFYIETQLNGAFASGVYVDGQWQSDLSGPQGSVFSFDTVLTDMVGNAYIANGRAPATWDFTPISGPCAGITSNNAAVPLQGAAYVDCIVVSGDAVKSASYSASPNPLDSSSPPATVSITGSGFTTTYGMPKVEYYYDDGTYVGAETATAATSTSISAPPPSGLGSDPTGIYVGLIQNATAGGGWTTIGVAALDLVTPTPPAVGSGGGGGCGTCGCGHKCTLGISPAPNPIRR
jgi:hypothetical protein